ncbi:MAG: SPOR domain-containing protein [Bacteroidales bacterium]|nr:SPOR domain-containing protein [Bacteroidales bacterium]
MDRKFLAVLALTMALTTGCDWIRAKLDMPTSEDIAKKKELIAQKEAAPGAADTLQAVDSTAQASIAEVEPEVQKSEPTASGLNIIPHSNLDKTYYVIVGAFKTDELVKASLKQHEGILETPFVFSGNGLKYVSIGGYATLEEARKALVQAHQSVPEAWVWKKK